MPFDGFLGPSSNDFSQTRILHRLSYFTIIFCNFKMKMQKSE